MDKEKKIEEMAKVLYAPTKAEYNEDYGRLCRGCQYWYNDMPCEVKHKCSFYIKTAEILQNTGYGNVKQAVKEFAEKLTKKFAKRISTLKEKEKGFRDKGDHESATRCIVAYCEIENVLNGIIDFFKEFYGED